MLARFNQISSRFSPSNDGGFAHQPVSARACVAQFLHDLRAQSTSESTVRNYSSDILQFIEFSQDNDIRTVLSEEKFKAFFADQQQKGLKSSTIQRKIVSLKMFSQWVEKNILSPTPASHTPTVHTSSIQPPSVKQSAAPTAVPTPVLSTPATSIAPPAAQSIPAQPTPTPKPEPPNVAEVALEAFAYSAPTSNKEALPTVPKSSHSIGDAQRAETAKKRQSYREWILGPYFHLATLVIFFIFISILWYRQFFVTVPEKLAYPSSPVSPDRILSFQARLTDVAGNPITTATNTTFRLYNDPVGGSLLWNSGTCSIDPDQDGIFSTILGSTCGGAIDESVFTENNEVWLEIAVLSDTLSPRQRIATVPFALNSETLQGFPINSTQSATRNTVLVMNQWGEVLLGEQSPELRSVSGTFSISGSTLRLVTNSGSNGDVTIDPDGTGLINLIGNVFNNGYLYTNGATISATYAGNIPLTINGTGGQVLTVNNVGDVTTAGDLIVNGGDITSSGDITLSPTGNHVLFSDNSVLNIGGASAQSFNFFADSTAGNNTASGDNDLYIQDILEVDGAVRFDSSLTLTSLNTAGGIVYTNGSGQLLVSAAGSNGDCLKSGGTNAPTWGSCGGAGLAGTWRIANGAHSPVNDTLDLLVGSDSTASAKFAVLNVNDGTPTASLSAGATGGTYLTADGTIQTTDNQSLTIGGNTTGDISFLPLNGSGNITATIGGTQLFNILNGNLKIGDATPTVALNGEDAYIEGTLEVDGAIRFENSSITLAGFATNGGILYTDSSGVLSQTAAGNAGECLKSNGGGAPVFGACATDNFWRLSNGALSSVNDTLDLLIGSTASTSAKFAVLNVNDGTPTASLSAGAAGGAYLTADGILQTTANQALTIGGNTTGDIDFSPLNGSGGVNFNLGTSRLLSILGGNLSVGNGSPDVSLNGEDAYIEGTLEVDGAVRFDSSLTVTTLNNAGGVIYANGSGQLLVTAAGSNGDCLQSGGTGAPVWGSCGTGGLAGTWRIANGAHSPVNDTLDLLIGSNASSSAKFAVLNVSDGTPTASLSAGATGGAYLTADGVLQTTDHQTLAIGGSTTGDITFSPQNGSGGLTVNLGAARSLNILSGNLIVGNDSPTVALNGEDAYIEGTIEVDGAVRFDNSSITLSSFTTDGGLLYTDSSGVLAQTGTGNSGECLKSNGSGAPTFQTCATDNFWRIATGTISPVNDTVDFLVGSNASTSAKFAVLNVNDGTPTASLSAGAAGGAYLSADGILQTTANQALTIGGNTTGDIAFSPLNGSGGVSFTLGSSRLMQILSGNLSVGNGSPDVSLNGVDAYIEGTLEVDGAVRFDSSLTVTTLNTAGGIVYTDGSGQLLVSSAGSGGDCLKSGGTGAPTWGSCLGGGLAGTWRIANGAHSPINDTLDLLIGSNASTSAKFAVLNVNDGTPTASLSAGTTGGAYLTAAGTLQSTANQTLTIGGNTTGDITLSPINGGGGVNVNLGASRLFNILTGNLKVGNGTPTVALNGEDAYIEGTLEVDGAVRFDNSSITLSSFTTNGGLLYTNASGVLAQSTAGSAGECLVSAGGGAPNWVNCSQAASNYWRLANGALSPVNNTLDFLIGSNASSSAKFAVLNVNDGTPTASLSAGSAGGAYLSATGALQTTANQPLTIGGNTTGDIALSPLNGQGGVTITSDLSAVSRSTDLLTLIQENDGTRDSTAHLLQLTNNDADSVASLLNIDQGGVGGKGLTITTDGTGTPIDLTGTTLTTGNGINILASALTSGNGINMSTTTSSSSLAAFTGHAINVALGRTYTGNGTVTDTGNFLNLARTVTQNTGTGTFAITGDVARFTSNCSASGGTCTDSSHILTLQQNFASATGSVLDVTNAGTGVGIALTSSSTGDLLQLDATGNGTTANGILIRQTGAGTITDAIDVSDETITNALNVGANTITGAGYNITSTGSGLTINSTSADLALTTTTSGNITGTLASANALLNVLTGNLKVGNGTPTVSLDGEDAYIEGTLEVDGAVRFDNSSITLSSFTTNGGVLYTNGSGVIAQTSVGSLGECLQSAGGGAPTWGSCGGANYWRINTGALSPVNDTLDFLVGSTASTSAKFAVLNVNDGTPTASLSAGSAGGAYLTASGAIQTTNNQTLTIGGNTTGDITLTPLNGAGMLTFNQDGVTSGLGLNLTADALTSGTAFFGQSTSTALTTGKLMSLDWSPTGTTEIFAGAGSALLNLNIGTYGNIDKIFNIQDDGTDLFSVSQSLISSALPHEFTAAGDVSVAYDLHFTNQTVSYIKSNAPLIIEAGESFENNDMTLTTYGTGNIILDPANAGYVQLEGATRLNSLITLANDATPDVSGGSYFVTGGTTTITDFDAGSGTLEDGHLIIILAAHSVTIDCTSNAEMNCGTADLVLAAGDVVTFIYSATSDIWSLISWMDTSDGQTGADLAELYAGPSDLSAGDIVSIKDNGSIMIQKAVTQDGSKTIGIVSTQPGLILDDGYAEGLTTHPIALTGRVPVKIASNSPEIKVGDPIMASNEAGKGTKATQAGFIVGRALESWNPNSPSDTINVFVNPVYYDPGHMADQLYSLQQQMAQLQTQMTTSGDLASQISTIAYDANGQPTNTFSIINIDGVYAVINNSTAQVVNQLLAASRAIFGQIEAGFIKTGSLITDTLTVNQKLVSPEVETNSLNANLISPLSDGDLTFKLGKNEESTLSVKNADNEEIVKIDQDGNTTIAGDLTTEGDASVSGELSAPVGRFEQLEAARAQLTTLNVESATISGQLYLPDGRSIQAILDENEGYLASLSAQTELITQQVQSAPQALTSSSFDEFLSQLTGSQDASISAAIEALAAEQNITLQATDMVLAPDAVFVKEYLNVSGYAQFNNANVASSLTIGNSLILTQDAIASANSTLYIQPAATSSVNILAGLLVLNPNGNVELNGNLLVSGDIKVGQKLNANAIQPNDFSSDFTLKLATESAVLGETIQSKFAILDASNSAVASIDASGSARFTELAAQGLVIQNPTTNASDEAALAESEKYKTVGSSVLPAGQTEFVIENYNVNGNVLINLTPTSDTANQVLFVKEKETCSGPVNLASCKKSFTVGIKNAVTKDISFNYWIVKVE